MYRKEIFASTTVEIQVTSTGQNKFPFPMNEDLRDAEAITGIESTSAALVTKSPGGLAVVNAACHKASSVTLQDHDATQQIQNWCLPLLDPANTYGEFKKLDIPPINPTQCFINVADITTLVLNEVFVITIYFKRKPRKNRG